jgi:hypothetical protein
MLFYPEPKRCIQQWVDAKTVVTVVSNGVAKCVRGSAARLRAIEAKAKAASPDGERKEGVRADHMPLRYVLEGGVGLCTRRTKESGDVPVVLPCPVLTGFYQTFFRGVDRADAVGAPCGQRWTLSVSFACRSCEAPPFPLRRSAPSTRSTSQATGRICPFTSLLLMLPW